jgi:hypothetical protein
MKFQAAERSVFGCKMIDSMERESVEAEIIHARWLVWHGKGSKALGRIKALDSRLLSREGYEFKTLWWNLNTISSYLTNNARTLVNYGARHRKGLPISSSIAESAVNHGCQLPYGQETTNALDRRRGALHGAGQGSGFEPGILAASHLGAQDCRLG